MQFACNANVFGLAEPAEAPDILPWPRNIGSSCVSWNASGPRWAGARKIQLPLVL